MAVCVNAFHKCLRLPTTLLKLRPVVHKLNATQITRTFCSTNALTGMGFIVKHTDKSTSFIIHTLQFQQGNIQSSMSGSMSKVKSVLSESQTTLKVLLEMWYLLNFLILTRNSTKWVHIPVFNQSIHFYNQSLTFQMIVEPWKV